MEASDLQRFVVLHPGYSRDIYYVAPTLFYVGILRSQGARLLSRRQKRRSRRDSIPPSSVAEKLIERRPLD